MLFRSFTELIELHALLEPSLITISPSELSCSQPHHERWQHLYNEELLTRLDHVQVQATQPSCGSTAPSAFKGKLRARRALKVHERGEHVMHHVPGLWNGIWSDMFIETTFMRYGHGPRGIIGITLKPETLKILALGLHISRCLEQDITSPLGKKQDISQEAHKEEIKARIGHMVLIDKAQPLY